MDRREFLRDLGVTSAALGYAAANGAAAEKTAAAERAEAVGSDPTLELGLSSGPAPEVTGHTLVCEFKVGATGWKVYEDLRTRDGAITFISAAGASRVLAKSAEATFAEADPPYLGLKLADIGMSGPDLLADKLLQHGDPDPAQVKSAAPPQGTAKEESRWRLPWNTFVGTKECSDTMPVFPSGNTRTYHPGQYFPEITNDTAKKRFEGLIGGWMPAVRKVIPISDTVYLEVVVFGDVEAHDRFIVQTWHRTTRVENGKVAKVVYGYSYPAFPPTREDPSAEEFYRALLVFAAYWEKQLQDFASAALPDDSWVSMAKHAFAKELMVRPGGVYPKYGAVDRDYYGPEYDGFQDIFTMAVYANLEWGRCDVAREIIDNYLTDFTDAKGMINMRGPETAQFGLTLSLLARYFNYTQDAALLEKHREKIVATAAILTELHDLSLQLPKDDVGYGIIHGWSESDSCLHPKPMVWWLPYFANNAFAARGLRDMGRVWPTIQPGAGPLAGRWLQRSKDLQDKMIASMRANVRGDVTPAYIGPLPGTTLMFRESLEKEHPSPQQWAHRAYAELLQPDVLPASLANTVIDCVRAYGGTILGVVANIERPHPEGRDILGFISYGYAQMLLRLDRVEEYLLFLYAHRYHDHTRGSWTAGEVSGVDGGTALFCIPAQQTIPLLVRWMLVLEDSDEGRIYFGKGLPRDWVASGSEIRIAEAPTRFGRVSFSMAADRGAKKVKAKIDLGKAGGVKEVHLKLRMPAANAVQRVTVNGRLVELSGGSRDTVIFPTGGEKRFEVVGQFI
jgi:hypothetical protein